MPPTTVHLHDIAVAGREDGKKKIGKASSTRTGNDSKWERKSLSDTSWVVPSDVHQSRDGSPSRQDQGNSKVDGSGGRMGQRTEGKKQGSVPQKELLVRFYKRYQREAEEHDREYMKKYDEDLNTTLIFAGLFSAVTSAFIILVHADFQPNLNEETTALLRVVIYTMDNTAFGGNAPTVPQWTGPPRTSVQVQAILFASLSVSLFAAFLAMLGKQWLNRCVPADMRGTIVERSQHRQRKIDGIANWYFDHVLESLPLMLQAALLLYGCALSRYLWDINTIVASVILGATLFGVLFYLIIVIVGVVSVDCPYQTPGAHLLRNIPGTLGYAPYMVRRVQAMLHRIPRTLRHTLEMLQRALSIPSLSYISNTLRSVSPTVIKNSGCCYSLILIGDELSQARHSVSSMAARLLEILLVYIPLFPLWLIVDAYSITIWLSVGFVHRVRRGLESELQIEQKTEQQVTLDLNCISWTLQTSLDGPFRQSALEYLGTIKPDDFDSTQTVAVWFDILTNCIKVTNNKASIAQGMEQPAAMSSLYLLHTLSNLVVIDPMPKVLQDVLRRYTKTFPSETNFDDPRISHTLKAIRHVFRPKRAGGSRPPSLVDDSTSHSHQQPWRVQWNDYKPSRDVYIKVARALTRLAWFEFQRGGHGKVPRWLLRFALHSLSQDPPAPPSVIACSLAIIAIDLECDVTLETVHATLSDQSAQVRLVLDELDEKLDEKLVTLADAGNWETLSRKHKAITALFPYAATQGQDGRHGILDVFLRAAKTSKSNGFLWDRVRPYVEPLLNDASDITLKRAAILASPYMPWSGWDEAEGVEDLVQAWATTASEISHEEEVAPSVVDALLQIVNLGLLQPYDHRGVWSRLTLRLLLPPICKGRRVGSTSSVVQVIRSLNNIGILKSYLLLVWSEWDSLWDSGFDAMCNSIRKDFRGGKMNSHRTDLVQRLDYVLGELDKGLDHLRQAIPELQERDFEKRKNQYEELRKILLAMDNCTSSGLIALFDPLTLVSAHRILLDVHVGTPYAVSVVDCLVHLVLSSFPASFARWFGCLLCFCHQIYLLPPPCLRPSYRHVFQRSTT